MVPLRLLKKGDAKVRVASGKTYDFEFQPDAAEEVPVEVQSSITGATVTETLVVQ